MTAQCSVQNVRMQSFLRACLALVAPPRSLGGELGGVVTFGERAALAKLEPLLLSRPALLGRGIAQLDSVVAGAPYGASPLLREAIARWKYRGGSAYLDTCVDVAARALRVRRAMGVLCPVPLHWSRRFWRGFNQAHVLAQALGQAAELDVWQILVRKRPTGAQARRSHEQRRHALDGAFAVIGRVPVHVTLVDDVMTTGATLDACALALRRAGCARVDAIVIAA